MVRRRVEQLIPIITVACLLVAAGGDHAGNSDASNSAESSISSEKVKTNQGLTSSDGTVRLGVADQRLTEGRADDSASMEYNSQLGAKARSGEDVNNSNEQRGLTEDAESLESGDRRSRTKRQANRRPYDAKSCLSCVDLYFEENSNELADLQETYSKCVLEAMDTTDLTNLLLFSPGLSSSSTSRGGISGGGGSWGHPTKTYFWMDDPDRNGRPLAEHFPADPDFMRKAQAALTLQAEEPTNIKTRERRGASRGKPSFGYSPGYPYPSPRPSDPLSTLTAKIQSCFLEKSEISNATQSGRVEPVVANVESFIDKMTGSDDAKRRMKRAASQCAGEQSRPARYSDWYECFWRKACDVCCSTPQSSDPDASGNFRRKLNVKQRSVDDDAVAIVGDDNARETGGNMS